MRKTCFLFSAFPSVFLENRFIHLFSEPQQMEEFMANNVTVNEGGNALLSKLSEANFHPEQKIQNDISKQVQELYDWSSVGGTNGSEYKTCLQRFQGSVEKSFSAIHQEYLQNLYNINVDTKHEVEGLKEAYKQEVDALRNYFEGEIQKLRERKEMYEHYMMAVPMSKEERALMQKVADTSIIVVPSSIYPPMSDEEYVNFLTNLKDEEDRESIKKLVNHIEGSDAFLKHASSILRNMPGLPPDIRSSVERDLAEDWNTPYKKHEILMSFAKKIQRHFKKGFCKKMLEFFTGGGDVMDNNEVSQFVREFVEVYVLEKIQNNDPIFQEMLRRSRRRLSPTRSSSTPYRTPVSPEKLKPIEAIAPMPQEVKKALLSQQDLHYPVPFLGEKVKTFEEAYSRLQEVLNPSNEKIQTAKEYLKNTFSYEGGEQGANELARFLAMKYVFDEKGNIVSAVEDMERRKPTQAEVQAALQKYAGGKLSFKTEKGGVILEKIPDEVLAQLQAKDKAMQVATTLFESEEMKEFTWADILEWLRAIFAFLSGDDESFYDLLDKQSAKKLAKKFTAPEKVEMPGEGETSHIALSGKDLDEKDKNDLRATDSRAQKYKKMVAEKVLEGKIPDGYTIGKVTFDEKKDTLNVEIVEREGEAENLGSDADSSALERDFAYRINPEIRFSSKKKRKKLKAALETVRDPDVKRFLANKELREKLIAPIQEYGGVQLLIAMIAQESAGREAARSSKGALGIVQIMPRTGVGLIKKYKEKYSNLFQESGIDTDVLNHPTEENIKKELKKPKVNILFALLHLKESLEGKNIKEYGENLNADQKRMILLMEYNMGGPNAKKILSKLTSFPETPEEFKEQLLKIDGSKKETANYVPGVMEFFNALVKTPKVEAMDIPESIKEGWNMTTEQADAIRRHIESYTVSEDDVKLEKVEPATLALAEYVLKGLENGEIKKVNADDVKISSAARNESTASGHDFGLALDFVIKGHPDDEDDKLQSIAEYIWEKYGTEKPIDKDALFHREGAQEGMWDNKSVFLLVHNESGNKGRHLHVDIKSILAEGTKGLRVPPFLYPNGTEIPRTNEKQQTWEKTDAAEKMRKEVKKSKASETSQTPKANDGGVSASSETKTEASQKQREEFNAKVRAAEILSQVDKLKDGKMLSVSNSLGESLSIQRNADDTYRFIFGETFEKKGEERDSVSPEDAKEILSRFLQKKPVSDTFALSSSTEEKESQDSNGSTRYPQKQPKGTENNFQSDLRKKINLLKGAPTKGTFVTIPIGRERFSIVFQGDNKFAIRNERQKILEEGMSDDEVVSFVEKIKEESSTSLEVSHNPDILPKISLYLTEYAKKYNLDAQQQEKLQTYAQNALSQFQPAEKPQENKKSHKAVDIEKKIKDLKDAYKAQSSENDTPYDKFAHAIVALESNNFANMGNETAIKMALERAEWGRKDREEDAQKDIAALIVDSFVHGGENKIQYLTDLKSNNYVAIGGAQFRPHNFEYFTDDNGKLLPLANMMNPEKREDVYRAIKTYMSSEKNGELTEKDIEKVMNISPENFRSILQLWHDYDSKNTGVGFTKPPDDLQGQANTFFDKEANIPDDLKTDVNTLANFVKKTMRYNLSSDYGLEIAGLLILGKEGEKQASTTTIQKKKRVSPAAEVEKN